MDHLTMTQRGALSATTCVSVDAVDNAVSYDALRIRQRKELRRQDTLLGSLLVYLLSHEHPRH